MHEVGSNSSEEDLEITRMRHMACNQLTQARSFQLPFGVRYADREGQPQPAHREKLHIHVP